MTDKIRILDRRSIPAGEILIEQGNVGNRAFLVESGRLEVFTYDKKGRYLKLAEVGPNSIVGEMALIDGKGRSASVRALEHTVVVGITEKDLFRSVGDPDGVFVRVLRIMVERLKEANGRLVMQNTELSDLEEAAQMTVKNISFQLPEHRQASFRREVVPLLDRLKGVLRKYNDALPEHRPHN